MENCIPDISLRILWQRPPRTVNDSPYALRPRRPRIPLDALVKVDDVNVVERERLTVVHRCLSRWGVAVDAVVRVERRRFWIAQRDDEGS